MRIGPETPRHNRGHCHYDPSLTGRICGAPATEHLWIGGMDSPGDPEAFTTYTCDTHKAAAHKGLNPTDWHEIGPDCTTRTSLWNATGTPGVSFCFEPDDDPGLLLAASEPIGATA